MERDVTHCQGVLRLDQEVVVETPVLEVMHCGREYGCQHRLFLRLGPCSAGHPAEGE